MGYSLSWVAVKLPHDDQKIKKLLGLKSKGNTKQYGTHGLVGCQLDNGWYLLIANKSNSKIISEKNLAELSKIGSIIASSIEEHVMSSSSELWRNGKKIWSLTHRGDEDPFDIVEKGSLPKEYLNIKKELLEKQKLEKTDSEPVDYIFDLPLLLAKELVGFKHDEACKTDASISYEIFNDGAQFNFLRHLRIPAWLQWIFWLLFIFISIIIIVSILAAVASTLYSFIKMILDF